MVEARVPRAGVVHGQLTALNRVHGPSHGGVVVDAGVLGDLDDDRAPHVGQSRRGAAVQQRRRGEVEAEEDLVGQVAGCFERHLDAGGLQLGAEADRVRLDETNVRRRAVVESRQRLVADDRAVQQVNDRLEHGVEAPGVDDVAQLASQRRAVSVGLGLSAEEGTGVGAEFLEVRETDLDLIHRDVIFGSEAQHPDQFALPTDRSQDDAAKVLRQRRLEHVGVAGPLGRAQVELDWTVLDALEQIDVGNQEELLVHVEDLRPAQRHRQQGARVVAQHDAHRVDVGQPSGGLAERAGRRLDRLGRSNRAHHLDNGVAVTLLA